MKRYWLLVMASALVAVSAVIYLIHYLIFHDPHHIFLYLVGDIAFVPIEVLLVVIVIERLLARHERRERRQKLNMIIGTFFSEVGNHLLADLLGFCKNRKEICRYLNVTQDWTASDFKKAKDCAYAMTPPLDYLNMDLGKLKSFLIRKRDFLVRLLDNPNILEHERFTSLLWAAFHLDEELEARQSLKDLPESDLEHIANDIYRVYGQLAAQWLAYLEHLKSEYPFLYSLILRTHPFQEHPSPVVA